MEINKDTKLYTEDGVLFATVGDIIDAIAEGANAAFTRLCDIWKKVNAHQLLFDDIDNAKRTLKEMRKVLSFYGCVTVADMHDLAKVAPKPSIEMNHRGWINLDDAEIARVGDDYTIQLSEPIHID